MSSEARSFGRGVVLTQKRASGEKRSVVYSRRSVGETERRYSQIEKVAVTITWALKHWTGFLIGIGYKI